MMTVPEVTGVRNRRNLENHAESANWNADEARTRVASIAGPPSASAVTQTAIKAPEAPVSSTWPAPSRPTRSAWSAVIAPATATATNAAHER